jgi:uncharacterized protein
MTDARTFDPVPRLSKELSITPKSVAAVVALLAEGNTVPFIARYRKEVTGGLDEVQIRSIEERRSYIVELEDRRAAILGSIDEQGKLTPELRAKILACETKAALEDLYLPYKPKRRTRGMIAREKGLEPLALRLAAQPADGNPEVEAAAFVSADKGVEDVEAALQGARDIVSEQLAENADTRAFVRNVYKTKGLLVSKGVPKKIKEGPTKFEQYYEFSEPVRSIPSHRYLAIRRGEREGVLRARIDVDADKLTPRVEAAANLAARSPFAGQLRIAVADCVKRLLGPSVENDLRVDLKLDSDRAAVDVFADNLRNLLLAAPLGTRGVIGIDPGLRTGCKCAALDATGTFRDHVTIYLTRGADAVERSKRELAAFIAKHTPAAIAVGNGTGGRETEAFVRDLLRDKEISDCFVVQVNESGASVYSASDTAREEFPDLDLTIRGAISIARRLQDPLAELVKIEPKAIGVGQYQHDVHQPMLARKLGDVVESCVNHVGVELNTASASLLSYVSGIGKSVAKKMVAHRAKNGAFRSRGELLKVSGLGPRAYEQAAGFLRIRGSNNPLDTSAVHPERYDLVERMASDVDVSLAELVGNRAHADRIDITKYVSEGVGEPTLRDILDELRKPGRDPRAEFEPPKFRDDVNTMQDLVEGMQLEGVVTNVTAFGAFVDVGVHQDGLVHVSQLADRFVKDPSDVVKVGDKIQVRVLSVDLARKRISLTARSDGGGGERRPAPPPRDDKPKRSKRGGGDERPKRGGGNERNKGGGRKPDSRKFSNNPFAALKKND